MTQECKNCDACGNSSVPCPLSLSGKRTNVSLKITDVRFESKADICVATGHVRFTPNSDRKSGPPQNAMSALPLKADMWSARVDIG